MSHHSIQPLASKDKLMFRKVQCSHEKYWLMQLHVEFTRPNIMNKKQKRLMGNEEKLDCLVVLDIIHIVTVFSFW